VSRGRRRGGRDVLERNGAEVMSMSRSMNHLRGAERNGAEQSEGDEHEPIDGGGRRASKVVKAG
jgi:hypothetical protein